MAAAVCRGSRRAWGRLWRGRALGGNETTKKKKNQKKKKKKKTPSVASSFCSGGPASGAACWCPGDCGRVGGRNVVHRLEFSDRGKSCLSLTGGTPLVEGPLPQEERFFASSDLLRGGCQPFAGVIGPRGDWFPKEK